MERGMRLNNETRLSLVRRLAARKGTLAYAVYDGPFGIGNALWERLGGDSRWLLYQVSSVR